MHRVNTSERWPVKIWASLLEPAAEAQALNLAKLPFIHKHVALMPDAHAGKGSTVGAVIATKGAVLPAAVGVDIGCLIGETLVPLLDGTRWSLQDLHEKYGESEFWVYSVRPSDLNIAAGRAHCVKTRDNAELCEVTISGGHTVTCTPDHPFMLRDGTYVAASELSTGQSLMPLYRTYEPRDGYERVYNPGTKSNIATHRQILTDEQKRQMANSKIVHHANHNNLDNTPENLVLLTAGQHAALHRLTDNPFKSETFQAKKAATIAKRGYFFRPEMAAKKAAVARANITNYMRTRPEHFAEAVKGNGKRGAPFLKAYYKKKAGETPPFNSYHGLKSCKQCGEVYPTTRKLTAHIRAEHNNHKVVSVKRLERRADVYCLQVAAHNNFALDAGVFVHNCGMKAVNLRMPLDAFGGTAKLRALRDDIEQHVPVGQASRSQPLPKTAPIYALAQARGWEERVCQRLAVQCGTLGGGNHFIELCGDETGNAWVVLHSGSRYVGKWLADKHIQSAKDLMKAYFVDLPDPDLAYLAEQTAEFNSYISDMQWAQNYAWSNRDAMMEQVLGACARAVGRHEIYFQAEEGVHCHHNYTTRENHFGANVWVTRKGAVCARKGVKGIIPGSMATRSYIVEGLGNADSFDSCAHGAGRAMSRTAAMNKYTLDDLIAQTAGVECSHRRSVVDEIPAAYKPIDTVMADQVDLVKPLHTLKQVLCVKG